MGKFSGFQSVKLTKPKRSEFDLSHEKRISTGIGRLTPCFITECVPGDSFRGSSEILLRLAPLLAPIYDQIQLYVHFFFVPNRLLWEDWEEFITGGRLGVGVEPVDAPIPPFIKIEDLKSFGVGGAGESTLSDYLGCPLFDQFTGDSGDYQDASIDYMPFLAYDLIYQEYYRDRNLESDDQLKLYPYPSGDVVVNVPTTLALVVKQRNHRKDYFMSALPFPQRGTEVILPVAGTAAVTYLDEANVISNSGADSDPMTVGGTGELFAVGATIGQVGVENIDEVTISGVTSTINDFRTAYALQVWLERNAVAGSRYVESIQAHFGVRPQDSRLQRPEYLGGGRIPVKISEVVSTAYSEDGEAIVPLANMAGHGITYGNTNEFRYFCAEHGFILGIMSIMPVPSYHQGLPRMFHRRSFLDYPWPTFAKLGEQEIKRYELFASPANMQPDPQTGEEPLWAYQSRYADWKYICSSNHGAFHSSLLFWTLTLNFLYAGVSGPSLTDGFVRVNPAMADRIFAVNDSADNFWCYVHNRVSVRRCLPYFGTPNTLGFV